MALAGDRRIVEILVIGDGEALCTPCGGCRQRIPRIRRSGDADPYRRAPKACGETFTLAELLPEVLRPRSSAYRVKGGAWEREQAYNRCAISIEDWPVQPETRYADSGGVNIAYQVLGDGPRDLVFVMGWVSNIEVFWEEPTLARFLTRLASFSRLILFDKRGTGLSDRVTDMPSLEVRMDDVRAVMDAVGSEARAALACRREVRCARASATYPSRVSALIMQGGFPRRLRTPDFPWGPTQEERQVWIEQMRREWGGTFGLAARAPSMVGDERFSRWWGRLLRMGASPAAVMALRRDERRD